MASVSNKTVVVAATPGPFLVPFDEYVDAILVPFMPGEYLLYFLIHILFY